MQLLTHIYQSLDAIKANLLRALLTIVIIAMGITALIVVQTGMAGIKNSLLGSFSVLGTNTFQIVNRSGTVRVAGRRSRQKRNQVISYEHAVGFKKAFADVAPVSISANGSRTATVRAGLEQTNPNVSIIGSDENYLTTSRYTIADGRTINADDIESARNVVVLGHTVKKKLFQSLDCIGKKVTIDGGFFTVIGVLDEIGSSGSTGGDKITIIPVSTLRSISPSPNRNFGINVYVEDIGAMAYTMDEAEGRFRLVRGMGPRDENDFSVIKSDAFVEDLFDNIKVLTWAAMAIAIITLIGASVALLNVMLVSVTERTNEIGIRKALGATQKGILTQFLTEAVLICQIGGISGILIGLIIGNIISVTALNSSFVAPWFWIIIGLIACIVVGVASGIYPAWKAAKVDPIESLRHE
ncbi:MAG: ABC transporter permease [Bacteroidia bacterium]